MSSTWSILGGAHSMSRGARSLAVGLARLGAANGVVRLQPGCKRARVQLVQGGRVGFKVWAVHCFPVRAQALSVD